MPVLLSWADLRCSGPWIVQLLYMIGCQLKWVTEGVCWRAQVYKGLWNEVQDVAVKMVVGQSAEQQARFLREVCARSSN